MTTTQTKKGVNHQQAPSLPGDPVLRSLHEAEEEYKEFRALWDEQSSELEATSEKLTREEAAGKRLAAQLESAKKHLDEEKKRAERERKRTKELTTCLKDVHRALFDGNIYSLILKACLTATGATRGLYMTARGSADFLKIRAAVDINGYPAAPPSDFIKALCYKALEEKDTVVCTRDDLSDLPNPSNPSEHFQNCAVAPVVLMKNFDGIVIVADKISGDFNEEDVEILLSVGDQASVAVENARLQRELQSAYLATVSMLADVVEAKDPYTHGHCEMVSRYARLTAEQLALKDYERSLVCYGALLHDVGKICVSDGVLNKPGPLLPEERELMRAHVRVGHDFLARVPALQTVANVVLHHHEWYDGSGYPEGLKGEEIPIAARIVCVVDAYCAMITKRSYKDAYSDQRARDELHRCAGTQFDAKVVEAFIKVLDMPEANDEDEDYDAECGVLPGFGQLRELQYA